MRGIAELVEVSKSAPATPSSIPPAMSPSAQFNGVGVADDHLVEDSTKTPEPPVETHPPPVVPVSKPYEQEGVAPNKPHPPTENASSAGEGGGGCSSFAKMRSMLAQQMGLTNHSDVGDFGQDSSDGPSPSQSPVVQRRDAAKSAVAPPPPPPKRGAGQAAAANRHSYSSSTSSLSSNQSERVPGSHDMRRSVDVPIAAYQQALQGGEPASPITQNQYQRKSQKIYLSENSIQHDRKIFSHKNYTKITFYRGAFPSQEELFSRGHHCRTG